MTRNQQIKWIARPAVFVALLAPFLVLAADALTGGLSVNPIEDVLHRSGKWGLRFLLLTLTITPLRRMFGWSVLMRFRRLVGLFSFFYLVLHFSIYLGLDRFFSMAEILEDIFTRPFITVGFASLLLLVPLAATSTNKMMKQPSTRSCWPFCLSFGFRCGSSRRNGADPGSRRSNQSFAAPRSPLPKTQFTAKLQLLPTARIPC